MITNNIHSEDRVTFDVIKQSDYQVYLNTDKYVNTIKTIDIYNQNIINTDAFDNNTQWEEFIIILNKNKVEPLFSKHAHIKKINNVKFKCLKCLREFKSYSFNPNNIKCKCSQNRSSYEDEICKWLYDYSIKLECNKVFKKDKRKFEIDIYCSQLRFGIDFHGLYWHSLKFAKQNYHYTKWDYFSERNIYFCQIFEHWWKNKSFVVKNIIMNELFGKIFSGEATFDIVGKSQYFELSSLYALDIPSDYDTVCLIKNNNKDIGAFLFNLFDNGKIEIGNFFSCSEYHFSSFFPFIIAFLKKETNCKSIYIKLNLMYHNYLKYSIYSTYKIRITKPNRYFILLKEGIKKANIVPLEGEIKSTLDSDSSSNYIHDAGNAYIRLI